MTMLKDTMLNMYLDFMTEKLYSGAIAENNTSVVILEHNYTRVQFNALVQILFHLVTKFAKAGFILRNTQFVFRFEGSTTALGIPKITFLPDKQRLVFTVSMAADISLLKSKLMNLEKMLGLTIEVGIL